MLTRSGCLSYGGSVRVPGGTRYTWFQCPANSNWLGRRDRYRASPPQTLRLSYPSFAGVAGTDRDRLGSLGGSDSAAADVANLAVRITREGVMALSRSLLTRIKRRPGTLWRCCN